MVVKITCPHSLQRVLNYNEHKCHKGQAECIHAENFLLLADQMNFHEKKERFSELISRNERAKKSNLLHISLNFHPSENLTKSDMIKIALQYMKEIGFANQPFLVYQHHDAGHNHIHIVTTNIQADGKRIDTYNIGRNQSETARKKIEIIFGLLRAEESHEHEIKSSQKDAQKVRYGKAETRRSIQNVLDHALKYNVTSLPEFNALLSRYNVKADPGIEGGRIHKNGGLLYRLLDENGNHIGVPIKASAFHQKPTLKYLEKKFLENAESRLPERKKLKTAIDWVLSRSPKTLDDFISALKKEKIEVVLRKNKDGLNYGITFVDYRTKLICNGSEIGKQYSIAGIQSKFKEIHDQGSTVKKPEPQKMIPKGKIIDLPPTKSTTESVENKESLIKDLMDVEKSLNRIPGELLKKKRKKRNKNL